MKLCSQGSRVSASAKGKCVDPICMLCQLSVVMYRTCAVNKDSQVPIEDHEESNMMHRDELRTQLF